MPGLTKYHLGQPSYGLGVFLSWSGAFGAAGNNEVTKLRPALRSKDMFGDFYPLSGAFGAAQNNEITKIRASGAPLQRDFLGF